MMAKKQAGNQKVRISSIIIDAKLIFHFPELDLPDPRTLAEPVNIIPKLPSNMQASLTSSKWKERKEVLDELLTLVNTTPRIQDAPELGELAKSLAACISKDANINCVMTAAHVMEGLAKGMMAPFGRLRETVIPLMLERLKERKANVTDTIGAALDAVFATVCGFEWIPHLWLMSYAQCRRLYPT
jgi:cytoskeleton-associated protein 5